jgi:hypothetical protein
MENVYAFLKKIVNFVWNWVKANGITGIGFGIIGLYYLSVGNGFLAGIGFGVFGTRNWDWILNGIKELGTNIGVKK